MITVGIIGILASVALPTFNRYKYRVRFKSSGLTKQWDYVNFAWEDLDGDAEITTYAEAIGSRDGELYRAGRFSNGDQSTIVHGWSAALTSMPTQLGGPGQ